MTGEAMSGISRRKALGALMAAPVAAKQAAEKMGLDSITDRGRAAGANVLGASEASPPSTDYPTPMTATEWARDAMKRLDSEQDRRDRMRRAHFVARTLDADLASFRSMSPASAHRIQRQRVFDEDEREQRANLNRVLRTGAW